MNPRRCCCAEEPALPRTEEIRRSPSEERRGLEMSSPGTHEGEAQHESFLSSRSQQLLRSGGDDDDDDDDEAAPPADHRLLDLERLVSFVVGAERAVGRRLLSAASRREEEEDGEPEKENSDRRSRRPRRAGEQEEAEDSHVHDLSDPMGLVRRLDSVLERLEALRRASDRAAARHRAARRRAAAAVLESQRILGSTPRSASPARAKDAGTAAADSEPTEELCLVVQRHLDLSLAHRVDSGEGTGSGSGL